MNTKTEWAIRYRRRFSDVVKIKKYETRTGAERFALKLMSGQEQWGELAEVQLCHREVGPWEYGYNEMAFER